MQLLLKNAKKEVLMFTLDGKWFQLNKMSTVKKLQLSDALKLDKLLRKISSQLLSIHQASLIKSFLIPVLPMKKEL